MYIPGCVFELIQVKEPSNIILSGVAVSELSFPDGSAPSQVSVEMSVKLVVKLIG